MFVHVHEHYVHVHAHYLHVYIYIECVITVGIEVAHVLKYTQTCLVFV